MRKLSHSGQSLQEKPVTRTKQLGASLMELMVALALSAVVTTSMVVLMGNSMGSATRIIQMSQLTDELRSAMSMMSRDVRRANYNANALYCFANSRCGENANASAVQAADIAITTTGTDQCFVFGLDRDFDGNSNNDGGGGFRRVTEDGIGRVELWVGSTVPNCAVDNGWLAITNPDLVNVTAFDVDNSPAVGSYENELIEEDETTLTQRVRFVRLQIVGQLNLDQTITREIVDTIKVRNDFYAHL